MSQVAYVADRRSPCFFHCPSRIFTCLFEAAVWKMLWDECPLSTPLGFPPSGLSERNLGGSAIWMVYPCITKTVGQAGTLLCLQEMQLCWGGGWLFIYCHPLGFTGVSLKPKNCWVRGLWPRLCSGDFRFYVFGLSFWEKPQVFVLFCFCFKQRSFRISGEAQESPTSCKKEESTFRGILKAINTTKIWDSSAGVSQPSLLKFLNLSFSVSVSLLDKCSHPSEIIKWDKKESFGEKVISIKFLKTSPSSYLRTIQTCLPGWKGHVCVQLGHHLPVIKACLFSSIKM